MSSSDLSAAFRSIARVDEEELEDCLGREGIYTGSIDQRNFQPHGQGRMKYPQHQIIYQGQWVAGDWSGFGMILDQRTGTSYEGSFLDNMKHGLGVMTFADGRRKIYDGSFQFDQMGKGKMTYMDGSMYWGYWSIDSLPHGRGKRTYPDGAVYDGEFENGSIQGHGRMTLPDGRWYLGEWTDGKKNGLGLEVLADGSLCHEGTFCNDHPVMCSSFPNRRMSTGSCLLYRTKSSGCSSRGALVGPIPRHLSTKDLFKNRPLQ